MVCIKHGPSLVIKALPIAWLMNMSMAVQFVTKTPDYDRNLNKKIDWSFNQSKDKSINLVKFFLTPRALWNT